MQSSTRFRFLHPTIIDPAMSHQPDNIFAGTQVVALGEVRGPSDSLVHLLSFSMFGSWFIGCG